MTESFSFEPMLAGMPFEVTVEADDFERFVIPRTVATPANQAKELNVVAEADADGTREAGRSDSRSCRSADGRRATAIDRLHGPANRR